MKKKMKKNIHNQELKHLISNYYQIQKSRIVFGNQISALKKENKKPILLEEHFKRFKQLEDDIAKDIKDEVKSYPIYQNFLKDVKGIGPILACALVATIDIKKAKHASSVWAFCGLDVADDGRARGKYKEHLVEKIYKNDKGKKIKTVGITYNPFLKTICWKIGESFVKTKGKYRKVYDDSREYYDKKFPKTKKNKNGKKIYTKGHKYNMAKRRAVKLFLSEFWAVWRDQENLSVSEPYQHKIEKAKADK